MGINWMSIKEISIHPNVKEAIVKATEHDTAPARRKFGNTIRLHKNEVNTDSRSKFQERMPDLRTWPV